jgi:hypothetical protein
MAFFKILRVNAIVTTVTLIVTLQILNVSVDPVDHSYGYEDLSINEIESCLELVLEVVLKRNDAVKETDEHDGASSKPHTRIVYIFNDMIGLVRNSTFELLPARNFSDRPSTFNSLTLPIIAPPPKAAQI